MTNSLTSWMTSYFVQYPLLKRWPCFKERHKILLYWDSVIPDRLSNGIKGVSVPKSSRSPDFNQ